MIVVTGAAGFIGSVTISYLLDMGHNRIVAIDDFTDMYKNANLRCKNILMRIHMDNGLNWVAENADDIQCVFHLGTLDNLVDISQAKDNDDNLLFSKALWQVCAKLNVPLIFASSAATYGDGSKGFDDDHESIPFLLPLDPYAQSKHLFDTWVFEQEKSPPHWFGFKFFNVYGPNEYHKGEMSSLIYHAFNQINQTGSFQLYRSHDQEIENGQIQRDFVYVRDVVEVLYWFCQNLPENGFYNLGTGQSRSYLQVVQSIFQMLKKEENIEFIDMPDPVRDTYQYFTEAKIDKLKNTGCPIIFRPLESGVREYIHDYLIPQKHI